MKIKIVIICLLFIYNVNAQDYKTKLQSTADFSALAHKPLSSKYGFVKSIKILYDLKNNKLYYTNSKRYLYHFEFIANYLETGESLENFNKYSYAAAHKNKRYLLGNINYYESLNTYSLELSPADKMTIKNILFLFNKIKASSYFKKFEFFLNTERLVTQKATLAIPTLEADEIYKNQLYQPISTEKAFGKLRFINVDSLKYLNIQKNDILIINKPILNLPIVNGVITTRMQTPLSHISVLGINRKIPVATYKHAYKSKQIKALNNKYVSFEVKLDTFYIKPISKKKFDRKTKSRKRKLKKLTMNSKIDSLIGGNFLNHKLVDVVGGKASNFGELFKLSKTNNFKVPECSFAIPFYYYLQHVKSAKTAILIKKTIDDYTLNKNDSVLKSNLKTIRNRIKKTPVNKELINRLNSKTKNCSYKRIRFRSSTNAEDIVGFSGAGLYTSRTGIVNDNKKTFEKAIKTVWASLWKNSAFLERELYNIDQNTVAMGILAHRSFPNEIANGVAITKNIYRKDFYGNVINLQLGEEPVVNPKSNITSEQLICYEGADIKLYKNKKAIEIISYSSLNNGKLILTQAEITNLSLQLYKLKKRFYRKIYRVNKSFLNFGLDVEFKIDGKNRDLYIKQVRYFND